MDVSKSGTLLEIDRLRPPKDIRTSILSSSYMEGESRVIHGLEMHDRFEQVFLASPRAQELYSSLEKAKEWKPTPQKPVFSCVPGFNEAVNLAESFHSNSSRNSTSATSLLAHHSSVAEERAPLPRTMRIRDFEVSPFRPSEIDSAIKRKVGMVINKLERDNASICDKTNNKGLSRVSGIIDHQSDSGVSMEGSLTNVTPGWKSRQRRSVISEKRRVGCKFPGLYSTKTEAEVTVPQTVPENQAVSLHSQSDEEVDVTEDVEDEKEDPVVGEETCNFTVPGGGNSLQQFSMVNKDPYPKIVNEEQKHEETRNGAENCKAPCSVLDDVVPETPQAIGIKNSLLLDGSEKKAQITNKKQEESTINRPHGKTVVDVNAVTQWSIKALKTRTHMGIIVEGQRRKDPDGDLWHSTAIVLRVNSRCVQTKSGSHYLLEGPIDEKVTLEQGFSKDFVKAFRNGFPRNWLSHVAKHFESESGEEESEDEKKHEQHRRVKNKKPSKGSSHSMKSTPDNLKKQGKASKDLKTPDNSLPPKEVQLQKTRSGRMVKPPLAWWRGQRIVTDRDHNMEGIAPGGQEHTPLSTLYNISIKIPLLDGLASTDKRSSSLQLRVSKSDVETNDDVSTRKIQNNKTSLNLRKLKSKESPVLAEKKNTAKAGPLKSEQSGYFSSNVQKLQDKDSSGQDRRDSKGHKSKPLKIGTEEKFSDKKKELASKDYQLRDISAYKDSNDTSELDGSSSSSSNNRDILKKQLFSSPKGTSEKLMHDNKAARRGPEIEVVSKEQGERKGDGKGKSFNKRQKDQVYNARKIATDRLQESSRLTVQESCLSEPSSSEGEIPRNHKIIKNKPTAKKVGQQNKKLERHRISNNVVTESESESTEQVLVKIPTPPTRVLRSHMSRLVSTEKSNTGASSEMDSEDLQDQHLHKKNSLRQRKSRYQKPQYSDSGSKLSSGDETASTCSTGHSENISTTRRKKKIIDKNPVHKRISEIARQTFSNDSQTSEEEYSKTLRKQSKKEQINTSRAKGVKQFEEHRREMMNGNKRTQSTTHKGNGKNESDSDVVVRSKKVSKVTPVTATSYRNPAEEVFDHAWKDDEIQRLNEALCVIPASIPMFWQTIASCVKSRTAQECQFQHQGQSLVPNKREALGKNGTAVAKKRLGEKVDSKQTVKTITGGVGTIKRKRELRELLEQQDVNYEDDIFDATPFKRKKNLKLPFNLNCNDSDEEEDDDDDENEAGDESGREQSTSYKTPSSRFRPLGPLSTSTTPGSEFISPSLLQQVNRKDMDHYIYRMQQGKRGVQTQVAKQKAKVTTSTPKKTGGQWRALDMELFEAQPASDHTSEEEEDQDYYFSDE